MKKRFKIELGVSWGSAEYYSDVRERWKALSCDFEIAGGYTRTHNEEFVESLRLDDFASDFERKYPAKADGSKTPLVLKIDVEGHTCHVAQGMKKILKNFKIVFVMMEWAYFSAHRCTPEMKLSVVEFFSNELGLKPVPANRNSNTMS